ncbi:hypothetical protein HPP92_010674 [Vanilla planifolia]|uniref:Uncharacterized protein n=1 Tax=Vanilla planifolia TaxID=51239 RepID=A0A835V1N6_VANPL|nr:hypothetical protein HPP92_010674 [Vanilla planifolia]
MAESDMQLNQSDVKVDEEKLQYLEIVHIAAIRAVLFVSSLYSYAKENAGPLRNGVESVEGTVKMSSARFISAIIRRPSSPSRPPSVRWESRSRSWTARSGGCQGCTPKPRRPSVARSVAGEVQQAGGQFCCWSREGCLPPCRAGLGRLAVSIWRSLDRLPVFPQVAHAVVPLPPTSSDRSTAPSPAPRRRAISFPRTFLSSLPGVSPRSSPRRFCG